MYTINNNTYECSVAVTIDVFNDKWKLFIIWHLLSGEKRFKELDEIFKDGISQKTLTVKLKELEAKHIIHREVYPEVPPKVVYSLTQIGEKLKPLLKEMYYWGIDYVKEHGQLQEGSKCSEAEIAKKLGL